MKMRNILAVVALVLVFGFATTCTHALLFGAATNAVTPVCDPRYISFPDDDGTWCVVAQPPVIAWPEYADYFEVPGRICDDEWEMYKDEVGMEWCVVYDWTEGVQ